MSGRSGLHDVLLNGKGRDASMSIAPNPNTLAQAPRGEYDLPLLELLRVIWRRFWVIALVVVVVVGATAYFTYQQTPIYAAQSKLLVGLQVGPDYANSNVPGGFASDVQGLQQFSKTAVGLSNSRSTANAVIRRLDLGVTPEHIQQNTSVEQVDGTQSLLISYRDPDPETAVEVVNALADVLSAQVPQMAPGGDSVTAMVWEEAVVPQDPLSPNKTRRAMLALAIGGMLGLGLAFLLERLDDRWRSPEEVEQVSGLPTFGTIPKFRPSKVPISKKRKRED